MDKVYVDEFCHNCEKHRKFVKSELGLFCFNCEMEREAGRQGRIKRNRKIETCGLDEVHDGVKVFHIRSKYMIDGSQYAFAFDSMYDMKKWIDDNKHSLKK